MARSYQRNPASARDSRIKAQYGISQSDYNELLDEQGSVCAICEQPESALKGGVIMPLSIDHDHDSGRVRGLLCIRCNIALGNFADDITRLERAIQYLKEHA